MLPETLLELTMHNKSFILLKIYILQWKPLSLITLGQNESDNINRLITLTEQAFRLVDCKNAKWASDNFNLLITFTK